LDAGVLPTLARLRADGRWREVESPAGLGDDAAWMSFCTGVDVDVHGRCYWQRLAPDGHRLYHTVRNATPLPPFWDALASSGSRVAVIDVPSLTGSAPDALVVSDWMVHAVERPEPFVRGPAPGATIARDPAWECDEIGRDADATRSFRRSLDERAGLRHEVLLGLLDEQDWDLFVTVASETHCVGHQRWHDADVVDEVVRTADTNLAELIDVAGPDAVVVVFSLLGMASNHSGEHLLDEILTRLDGAKSRPSLRLRAMQVVRRVTPAALRRRAPGRVREAKQRVVTTERSRRSAWLVPTDLPTSAIRIGVAGRDDGGTVQPGGALSDRCVQLAAELRALVDPDTGRALVDDVIDVRRVHGPRAADEFADLLVVWSQAAPVVAARSASIGVVRGAPPRMRTGNHTSHGWVVAAGPGAAEAMGAHAMAASDFATFVGTLVVRRGR
jgi:predicted AlkP superfamily phosphohydrolase/phosphomutase